MHETKRVASLSHYLPQVFFASTVTFSYWTRVSELDSIMHASLYQPCKTQLRA